MKLQGKVIKLESGSEFTDGLERVYVKILDGDKDTPYSDPYQVFRTVNTDQLQLDDDVSVHVSPVVKELSRAAS